MSFRLNLHIFQAPHSHSVTFRYHPSASKLSGIPQSITHPLAAKIPPKISPIAPLRLQALTTHFRPYSITRTETTARMSSTTHHLRTPAAPWKAAFLSHVNEHMDSPEFVLATLSPSTSTSSPSDPTPYLPRARFCIFRGMWAELPENKHNTAPRNARVFESELPTFTTDVRMQKVGELFASSEGRADREGLVQGSGGGGPVEAVWWVKGDVMVQWRMKGRAYVVDGADVEGALYHFPIAHGTGIAPSQKGFMAACTTCTT